MVVTEVRSSNNVLDLRAHTWFTDEIKTQDSDYRFVCNWIGYAIHQDSTISAANTMHR